MNIYFSGIGGVGIGPLAEIALDAGYEVTGSDPEDTLITKELLQKGISISKSQDGSFLRECHKIKTINLFVYTSALKADHPELLLASELGIKTVKRDELICQILSDKKLKLIAVAGTHGKTTVTGMFIWAMKQLNLPISYSIGTTITFGPSGKYNPDSEYFVYECDEFDRNFLKFNPYLSLLTSIDYDHPDTYPTKYEYLEAFHQFVKQSNQAIAWDDQHEEIYSDTPNVTLIDPTAINNELHVLGRQNRRNAALVKAGLDKLGITDNVYEILTAFPGTDRRFEKLADNLYSDYGHHPVEIAATLQLASEISDHIVLVYQPHQNVRQHEIRNQYIDQFEKAEAIYWLPTYLTREDPNLPILTPEELTRNITNQASVHLADFNDDLWTAIQTARRDGKLVVGMGAGKIDEWLREKLASSS